MMLRMLLLFAGVWTARSQARPGERCAQGFCENSEDCPRCGDGLTCFVDAEICGGTCYGTCKRRGDVDQRCAKGFCEDTNDCPRCRRRLVCFVDEDAVCAGTCYGTCKRRGDVGQRCTQEHCEDGTDCPRCMSGLVCSAEEGYGVCQERNMCTLSGGDAVDQGWSGHDTGDNWCNACYCGEEGDLVCTTDADCDPGDSSACRTDDGRVYASGETDNTNPCMPRECHEGEWATIIIDCAEPMGVPCDNGAYVPAPDGECCSTCESQCTLDNGEIVSSGWEGAVDCNTCFCDASGHLICTEMACTPSACFDDEGQMYENGATEYSMDPCVTRQCVEGEWIEMAMSCLMPVCGDDEIEYTTKEECCSRCDIPENLCAQCVADRGRAWIANKCIENCAGIVGAACYDTVEKCRTLAYGEASASSGDADDAAFPVFALVLIVISMVGIVGFVARVMYTRRRRRERIIFVADAKIISEGSPALVTDGDFVQ